MFTSSITNFIILLVYSKIGQSQAQIDDLLKKIQENAVHHTVCQDASWKCFISHQEIVKDFNLVNKVFQTPPILFVQLQVWSTGWYWGESGTWLG